MFDAGAAYLCSFCLFFCSKNLVWAPRGFFEVLLLGSVPVFRISVVGLRVCVFLGARFCTIDVLLYSISSQYEDLFHHSFFINLTSQCSQRSEGSSSINM